MVVPLLNPFIYSLRNKDRRVALKKLLSRTVPSRSSDRTAIEGLLCTGPQWGVGDTEIHAIPTLEVFKVQQGIEPCK